MICVVDASVAVKWLVEGEWFQPEEHVDTALELLRASAEYVDKAKELGQIVWLPDLRLPTP